MLFFVTGAVKFDKVAFLEFLIVFSEPLNDELLTGLNFLKATLNLDVKGCLIAIYLYNEKRTLYRFNLFNHNFLSNAFLYYLSIEMTAVI